MKIQAMEIAEAIIDNIGKAENIKSVRCCSRRIRFRLKNAANTKEENIKRINGIIGIIEADDKYYVILEEGKNIKVYKEIIKILGIEKEEGPDIIKETKVNKALNSVEVDNKKVKKDGFMKKIMNAIKGNAKN